MEIIIKRLKPGQWQATFTGSGGGKVTLYAKSYGELITDLYRFVPQ